MKILHFLDSLNRGGAEMQVLDICRNAADFGFELTLVTAKGGALEAEFRSSGAHFVRLSRKAPLDLYLASQLRKIIRERQIEIVHGYQPVEGLHLYLAAHGLRQVKKVLSFQGFLPDRKNRLTARFLIPRMDANVIVSRGLQKYLKNFDRLDTGRNFTVLHNGADPKRLQPTGKSLRAELDLKPDTPLCGMIGNFYRDPRKDQLTVCRALPAVFAAIPDAHCIFAGKIEEGAEEKMADCINFCLENNIIEKVHFLGGRGDVPDILAALDLFVFSSLHEGLPIAVSEAMLAGVPMILSDIEPLLEVSRNGEYAEIFPVGQSDVLGEKIVRLLSSETLRQDLAARARTFAEENFSIGAHLKHLVKLYQSIT